MSLFLHKKRKTKYEIVGRANIQTEHQLYDMQEVVVYRSTTDGSLWVRPVSEFFDGRFMEVPDDREHTK